MKVILLTSESLRHKYIASCLAAEFHLQLVITEEKSASIEATSHLKEGDAAFISAHFKARRENEVEYFGDFKEFPNGVPVGQVPHGTINNESVADHVDRYEPDYLVLFGTSIIKEPLMSKYSGRIINLHLGLSPYYKGSATNLFPYYHNEPECVGATIHLATPNVDDGPVLHQLRPDIERNDDLHSIGNKTILKAGKVLPEVIKAFSENKILPQKQTGTGKICRNKDLTPALLREIYSNFESGMIGEYLKEKDIRDGGKSIVEG